MVQLLERPEAITEDLTLEECRELLKDALHEMISASSSNTDRDCLQLREHHEASIVVNHKRQVDMTYISDYHVRHEHKADTADG